MKVLGYAFAADKGSLRNLLTCIPAADQRIILQIAQQKESESRTFAAHDSSRTYQVSDKGAGWVLVCCLFAKPDGSTTLEANENLREILRVATHHSITLIGRLVTDGSAIEEQLQLLVGSLLRN